MPIQHLNIHQEKSPDGVTLATVFRYYHAANLVCELRLPCDATGMITPDGTRMLIAYLERLISPYQAPTKG